MDTKMSYECSLSSHNPLRVPQNIPEVGGLKSRLSARLIFIFKCMSAYMFVSGVPGSQERPLELNLQMTVCCHMGAGTQTLQG